MILAIAQAVVVDEHPLGKMDFFLPLDLDGGYHPGFFTSATSHFDQFVGIVSP